MRRGVIVMKCTGSARSGQDQSSTKPGVGYRFIPTPALARNLCVSKRIKPDDVFLLNVLLQLRRGLTGSCWTTVGYLERRLGWSESKVHRTLARLRKAGLIRHERVSKVDPDDPANKTGWRIYFHFIGGSEGASL